MSHLLDYRIGHFMCQSTAIIHHSINSTVDTDVSNMVEIVSNYGITMVISVVVVLFLIRVLDTLLKQTTQSINQIIPKIETLVTAISELRASVVESITTHNLSMNKKIRELDLKIDGCKGNFDYINGKIDRIETTAHNMEVQVEKLEGILLVLTSRLEQLQDIDKNDKK